MAERDPYGIGLAELNDTPWYQAGGRADNRRGTERSLGFCNWAGFEDGRVVVMGGLADARHESYLWRCENFAQGRYWMTCVNGHRSKEPVNLCYGHVWTIQHHHSRARNMLCPPCAFTPKARELEEKMNDRMRKLGDPYARVEDRRRWVQEMEDAQAEMTELFHRGIIKTGGPLRFEEVS